MPRMTGGEATVQALLAQGVDTLFVLPGVQNDALFSALYDAAERLKVIVTRHEQAAGYTAREMNGAAMSSLGSNGSCACKPGLFVSSRLSCSSSAHTGLSRRRCIACVVSDQSARSLPSYSAAI